MIQIKEKTQIPVPTILQDRGIAAMQKLINRYETGEKQFTSDDFDGSIYGAETVKKVLKQAQNGKCCYCESTLEHVTHGDVEHFRPKAGWVQDQESLNKPGYYWLAYDWDNLLFSCQICNQTHKKNYFPLLNTEARAYNHQYSIADEQPMLVHPANENPEEFIGFEEEVPVAVGGSSRGLETIVRLGLDRKQLNENRMKMLSRIKKIYYLAKGIPATSTELKNEAIQLLNEYLQPAITGQAEYAAMLRAFFINNPIDF